MMCTKTWLWCGLFSMALLAPGIVLSQNSARSVFDSPWPRHTIDDSSLGSDGTKFSDVNNDGKFDLVTGWEEGGVSRIYLQPEDPKQKWPFIELPSPDVEDAFVSDLNGDGYMDLITLSEGKHQRVTIHWAPADEADYLDAQNWVSKDIPVTVGKTKWMFGRPIDLDGKNGPDLVVGSKDPNGTLGWLEAPEDPLKMEDWKYHEISSLGWVMSIELLDMNSDGEVDIVITDRKGDLRGLRWLENPGKKALTNAWENHFLGIRDGEPMFMDFFEAGKGQKEIDFIVPVYQHGWEHFVKNGGIWESQTILFPDFVGERAKSVNIGDINNDGQLDLTATFSQSLGKSGVIAMMSFQTDNPYFIDISGKEGVKYDFILLKDMDADGDLDLITSEETAADGSKKGLGVIWYENPIK
ncbi:VCBS repeat-containing protein [Cyclobacterium sp. 1_MG-2023]|uniref:FG-GAP repeat domain-containing protein n=1 Tax=Cyclobacterium sp. 1_MG-2023 TaxID=3062681 RepID=UPI0026E159CE|nr:VCBS repeat-containing protein [Cyclobacterium sp. 1_MG-2023]MDO6436528.1 VCBS repeat-containing protein [Cyclobacterium sp. 1_MG-2023]